MARARERYNQMTEEERAALRERMERYRAEAKERERLEQLRQRERWEAAERERERRRYYRELEERRRWDEWARLNGYGTWSIYGTNPSTSSNSSGIQSVSRYFNRNDAFFSSMISYRETSPENYLRYFDEPLKPENEPLFPVFGREFFPNEFPFVTRDWVLYYEPDLDDIFIDFSKIGFDRYEVIVWTAVGETQEKVDKKLKNVLPVRRPVIVQRIGTLRQDRIYSFSVKGMPKGDYEIRLIARDGSALRQIITIK